MTHKKVKTHSKTSRMLTSSMALGIALGAIALHGCQEVALEEGDEIIELDETDKVPNSKEYQDFLAANEGVYLRAAGSARALGDGKGEVYKLNEDGVFEKVQNVTNTTFFHDNFYTAVTIYAQPNFQGTECHIQLSNSFALPNTYALDFVNSNVCGIDWNNKMKSYRRDSNTNLCLYDTGLSDTNPTCYGPDTSSPGKQTADWTGFGVSALKITAYDKDDGRFTVTEGGNDKIVVYGWSRSLTASHYDAYEKNLSAIEINDYDLDSANYNNDDSKLGVSIEATDSRDAVEAADISSLAGYFNGLPSGIRSIILAEYAGKIRRCNPRNTCWDGNNCTGTNIATTYNECREYASEPNPIFDAESYCTPLGYCVHLPDGNFVLQ